MTAQINDTFMFRNESYNIAAMKGERLLTPQDFGMVPGAMHTACWRGYYCTYAIDQNNFYLSTMTLRAQGGQYQLIEGVSHKMVNNNGVYEGLRVRVPFTGRMLLGKDFIREMYVHMGFQRPISYRTVFEVGLKDGTILFEADRSQQIAEMRNRFLANLKSPRANQEITDWVEFTFSREFDKEMDS
jgi:hypothetical protein